MGKTPEDEVPITILSGTIIGNQRVEKLCKELAQQQLERATQPHPSDSLATALDVSNSVVVYQPTEDDIRGRVLDMVDQVA